MELVTVAIPTMKRLAYLREAVASALAQSYPDVEVLIGQDPGPAGPDRAVQEWSLAAAVGNARIRYQRNERTLGLAGNWNALARAARGSFLVIIGDDDRLTSTFAERLMEARCDTWDVIFCNHHVIDAAGERIPDAGAAFAQRYTRDRLPRGPLVEPERLAWRGAIPMSAALVRTEAVRSLRFREDLNTPEMEFFIRLARAGGRFCFEPDYLAEYRVHDRSETASGLRLERLVRYLLAIEVAAQVEADKAATLRALLPAAVSRCLAAGESAEARRLFLSRYYPNTERFRPRGLAQAVSSLLPAALGRRLYVALRRVGSTPTRSRGPASAAGEPR
jgi:glycosyltransferase involved in cell wall biosynthesis